MKYLNKMMDRNDYMHTFSDIQYVSHVAFYRKIIDVCLRLQGWREILKMSFQLIVLENRSHQMPVDFPRKRLSYLHASWLFDGIRNLEYILQTI